MNRVIKYAAVAALALGSVSLSAASASAAVVCNGENQCWHVKQNYDYKPEFGVTVHPDNWRWGSDEHYSWHEHDGRGYWRNGAWITF